MAICEGNPQTEFSKKKAVMFYDSPINIVLKDFISFHKSLYQ